MKFTEEDKKAIIVALIGDTEFITRIIERITPVITKAIESFNNDGAR